MLTLSLNIRLAKELLLALETVFQMILCFSSTCTRSVEVYPHSAEHKPIYKAEQRVNLVFLLNFKLYQEDFWNHSRPLRGRNLPNTDVYPLS